MLGRRAQIGVCANSLSGVLLVCETNRTLQLQALMGRSNTAYSQTELMHAFTLFADPDGTHGFISHKVLKSALVCCDSHCCTHDSCTAFRISSVSLAGEVLQKQAFQQ